MGEDGHKVTLNVYDLSQGLARQLSATFLGKAIEAIWHTGIVVYGNEYYFGGGIQHSPAGRTPYGTPMRVVDLGTTHIPKDVFESYLEEISPRYSAETYSLLTHNCNNFSNEVAQFLVGTGIPNYILQLPNEVMSSPMGALILPMIQNIESTMKAGAVPQIPQFRPPPPAEPFGAFSKDSGPRPTPKFNEADNKAKIDTEASSKSEESKAAGDKVTVTACPPSQQDKVHDSLGDTRAKVQEEISREFAAIMAQGTLRASEAAAVATRKVMQKYGHINVASS